MEKIILKRKFLDLKATEDLKGLYCDLKYHTQEMIKLKHLIMQNELLLFGMFINEDLIGHVLCRVDGYEFVIVAVKAHARQRDLTNEVLPVLEDLAIDLKCESLRIHTARPGLVKKLENLHYKSSEVVLRKEFY